MISVLGWELDSAVAALEAEGYTVFTSETRSKKGVNGDSKRVVRQRSVENQSVELCFSCVKTLPVRLEEADERINEKENM